MIQGLLLFIYLFIFLLLGGSFFTLFPGDRKETRSVMSRYHGNKISGSQQSFFQKRPFALSNDGSHSRQFFFLQYLQDLGLLKSRNFANMAT